MAGDLGGHLAAILGRGPQDQDLGVGAVQQPHQVVAAEAAGRVGAGRDDHAVEVLVLEDPSQRVAIGATAHDAPVDRHVLVDRALPEADLLSEAFRAGAGGKVEISVPQRGDRRRLIAQATRNAVEALDRRLAESGTKAKILRELAEFDGACRVAAMQE